MIEKELQDHYEDFVNQKIQELSVHFDAVQVFVTSLEPGDRTMAYSSGKGNFYSRWGMVNEWMNRGVQIDDTVPDSEEDEDGDCPPESN